MNRNIALIFPLLFLPFPILALGDSSNSSSSASETQYCSQKMSYASGENFSEKQLQNIASQITVRVKGDNNGGSGTLLAKQGNSYLVITNAHVVRGVNSLHLQIAGGTWEALEKVLQRAGHHKGGLEKTRAAREISQHMNPSNNRSKSFQIFYDGLLEIIP